MIEGTTDEELKNRDWTAEQKKQIEYLTGELLKVIDKNPHREGLKETPHRVMKYLTEMLQGQLFTNEEIAQMFDKCFAFGDVDGDENDSEPTEITPTNDTGLVVEDNIHTFSTCEHHLALMYNMTVTVAYIPKGKVIGLSKIARIVDLCAKRLQLQEKLGQDIAEVMRLVLGTEDVAVIISGQHACMTARGAKSREAYTKTSALYGRFMTNPQLRAELLALKNS